MKLLLRKFTTLFFERLWSSLIVSSFSWLFLIVPDRSWSCFDIFLIVLDRSKLVNNDQHDQILSNFQNFERHITLSCFYFNTCLLLKRWHSSIRRGRSATVTGSTTPLRAHGASRALLVPSFRCSSALAGWN